MLARDLVVPVLIISFVNIEFELVHSFWIIYIYIYIYISSFVESLAKTKPPRAFLHSQCFDLTVETVILCY